MSLATAAFFLQRKKIRTEIDGLRASVDRLQDVFGSLPPYIDGLPSVPKEKALEIAVEGLRAEGEKAMEECRWNEAIEYFNRTLALVNGKDKAVLLSKRGRCHWVSGNLGEAEADLQQSLQIAKSMKDSKGQASSLGNIGLIYQDKGDLDQALKYHQDALEIARQIGYRQGEASDLGNIGIVFYLKGELDQALKYQQDALKIHREVGYRQGEASDLGNIGLTYQAKGDLDQALKYLNEALKMFEDLGMPQPMELTKRNIEGISQQMQQMKPDEKRERTASPKKEKEET